MLDLQATLEFAVELSKFHNIDLFQRGFYQIRLHLKPSTKSPLQYEVTLPRYFGQECAYPPLIQDRTGISKTFQILYKNEEAEIGDFFIFKVYVLVDSKQIAESLAEAELHLQVDLHFRTSEDPPSCAETLDLISSRTVQIHLDSSHAIHSHIPLLFDYFHLCTLDMTVHGTLLGLHQATFSAPKPPKSSWMGKLSTNNLSPSRQPSEIPTMESVLFGDLRPPPVAAKASPDEIEVAGAQLGQAYQAYRMMASMLLNRRQALCQKFQELVLLTSQSEEFKLEAMDVNARLEIMCEIIRGLINTDDIVEAVNTSMAQLSGEVCLLWTQFLEFFGQNCKVVGYLRQQYHQLRVHDKCLAATLTEQSLSGEVCLLWTQFLEFFGQNSKVVSYLRQQYHQLRMHRFAEGYFHCNHSPMDLISQTHFTPQDYSHVTNTYRGSAYCSSIRPLPLECQELDGVPYEMPVIFEDVFSYSASTPVETRVAVPARVPEVSSTSTQPSTNEESDSSNNHRSSNSTNGHHRSGKKSKRKGAKKRAKYTPMSSIRHIRPEFMRRSRPARPRPPLDRDLSCYQVARDPCVKLRASSLDEDAEHAAEQLVVTSSVSLPSIPASVSLEKLGEHELGAVSGRRVISTSSAIIEEGHAGCESRDSVNGAIDSDRGEDVGRTVGEHDAKEMLDSAILPKSLMEETEGRSSCNGHDASLVANPEEARGGTERMAPACSEDQLPLATADIALVVDDVGQGSDEGSGSSSSLERIPNGFYEGPDNDEVSDVSDQVRDKLTLGSRDGEEEQQESEVFQDRDDVAVGRDRDHGTEEGGKDGRVGYVRQDTVPYDDVQDSEDQTHQTEHQTKQTELPDHDQRDIRSDLSLSTGGHNHHHHQSKRQHSNSPSVLGSCAGCFSFVGGATVSPNSSFTVEPCLIRPILPDTSSASTSMSSVQATGGHTPKSSTSSSEDSSSAAIARAQYLSAKKDFCQHLGGCLHLYSDLGSYAALHPYFSIPRTPVGIPDEPVGEGAEVHLVVCVHGLDGNRADLRLLKMYIEMGLPQERFEFLMSESNQEDTFAGFDRMTDRLVQEIVYYVELLRLRPKKVSFIGHSLGNLIIRSALAKPAMGPFLDKLHTFLSLSGPHLGQLYNSSTLVNTGLWVMQKWKKSNSLLQLSLRDHTDPRQSFLYQLSKYPGLAMFRNVLLVGSLQDRYVPVHSARVEMCKAAAKDKSIYGTIYAEMLNNLLEPVITSPHVTLVRYDVHHSLQTSANSLIGRAAHIAFLDSELFLEKFLMVSALSYFR